MEDNRGSRSAGLAMRLRATRERLGLSQSDLSLRAGLDRKCCFQIESQQSRNCGVVTVEKLADAMGVPAAWLAYGEGAQSVLVANLRSELAALKHDRLLMNEALAAAGVGDEDDEDDEDDETDEDDEDDWREDDGDDEDDEDDLGEEEGGAVRGSAEEQDPQHLPPRKPIWPYGFRPAFGRYPELEPLGLHYSPIFAALSPHLPMERRLEIGHSLTVLLNPDEERWHQQQHAQAIDMMLRVLVPKKDHQVVDLVMHDLNNCDLAVRGMMSLSLIIDGGLPVKYIDLQAVRQQCGRGPLRDALDAALEILSVFKRRHVKRLLEDRLLPPAPTSDTPLLGP